jgi:LacI family transcriptional regulator
MEYLDKQRTGSGNAPTMADVAKVAGVGVATVDRVINRRAPVKPETALKVLTAAESIGFKRTGLIKRRLDEQSGGVRLAIVLQRSSAFYEVLAEYLEGSSRVWSERYRTPFSLTIEFMDDLRPASVVHRLSGLSEQHDVIGLVAADHPLIFQEVDRLCSIGVPVLALVSDLPAKSIPAFVGLNPVLLGQMAAHSLVSRTDLNGCVGVLMGSHRYLCQEDAERAFRRYLGKHSSVEVLENMLSLEDRRMAHLGLLELFDQHPDMSAIYVAGGGIEGVIDALKEANRKDLFVICHDLTPITQEALKEGWIDLVLSHPYEALARSIIDTQLELALLKQLPSKRVIHHPFVTYTVANID